jgi:glutamate synthase domain-containing protein 1
MASGCLGARSAKGHKILTFVDPQTPFFEKNRFERDIADNVVKQVDWTQEFYPCTLSSRTIVYKGMLTPEQV